MIEATIGPGGLVHLKGFMPRDVVLIPGEARELRDALNVVLGDYIHEPGGCKSDCPCKIYDREHR